VLTIFLLIGLMVVAPIADVILTAIGFPISRPLLVSVGAVWICYSIIIYLMDSIIDGVFIGLLVAATFSADIPLTASADLYPGHSVGTLMMYHGPLLGLLAVLVWRHHGQFKLPTSAYAFGVFIGTTLLAAFLGAGPAPFAALWFSVYAAVGLLVYLAILFGLQESSLSLSDAVKVLLLTVFAQALVASLQLANGEAFGFSELGEPGTHIVAKLVFAKFILPLGTHVGGFTGMAFQFSNLLILTFPLLIVAFVRFEDWKRIGPVIIGLWFVLLIRGSSSDAARGALLVTMIVFGAGTALIHRPSVTSLSARIYNSVREIVTGIVSLGAMLGLLLYPSTGAGDASVEGASDTSGSTSPSNPTSTSDSTATTGERVGDSIADWFQPLYDLSLPLFDLSYLGSRLDQYAAGLEVFIQYPIFGLGGNNFVLIGQQYGIRSPAYTDVTFSIHNLYISLLAGTGIAGLLSFVVLISTIYWYGYRATRSHNDSLLSLALLAGLSGTLSFMMFDKFLLTNSASWAQFWIIAAFITASSE
jgi:hypothetical protein